jgi:molybdenum cofactor cytidylyltransferase
MDEYNTEKTIAALILAAGRSSRMQYGRESDHKLLLPLGQGTVLSHVIAAALASQACPILLVLGYQSEQIRASLTPYFNTLPDTVRSDIIIIENTAYAQGMSTSLHKGIQILMNQDNSLRVRTSTMSANIGAIESEGVLVLLGDQPLITPILLNQLIEMKSTTDKPIIAPFYNGKRRNPVLFAADLFPELLTITGDEGARSIIERHHTEVGRLDVDDSQLWYDVDTWEGYQEILRIWGERRQGL